ncbi:hypothetical protein [Maritimibacter alkaliphilus]|uniref:Uncharacterized protein n=1 Tax=Maritimibacter alkaliphilus HTCC2654 TaxID=314271 RepID=A3VEG3_9RHOB|nr:hypothetical protein [Maritimibacter alkaliphilus]EAQ13301.1 hypothetical protein RB2654_09534 [Rhodobacterales bacterium HTCC2654] [Maritimibacter alkaliphilus HTCC2654]
MSLAKALILSIILAFIGMFEVTMNVGSHHDPGVEISQTHCESCPEATEMDTSRAHAGACSSGASCMLNAVEAAQQPIVFVQMTSDWMTPAPSSTFASTQPQLDLPPPRA